VNDLADRVMTTGATFRHEPFAAEVLLKAIADLLLASEC
jgi:hypothetical protein